jgi:hypothetical protein
MTAEITWTRRAFASIGRLPPWLLTAAAGVAYVITAPPSTDLAAAAYRSDLLSRVGFTIWDNSWYAGHSLPAYSLLGPALGALLGNQLLTALSMTAAVALFAALLKGLFPARTVRVASLWLAFGAAVGLLANRVPFDLGLAIALAALLAARHARSRPSLWAIALSLSLLASVASPVAGAFLALALLAWTLAGNVPAGGGGGRLLGWANAVGRSRPVGRERWWPPALTLAALAPIAVLELLFPEGGDQPFVASAFYPALLGAVFILAMIPAREGVLRIGAALYSLALIGAYILPSAVGGNVDRLGALFAGPLAACVMSGRDRRRTWMLVLVAPLLTYWQVNAPIADFLDAHSDPAVSSSYYTPLLAELRTLGVGYGARPARIEVVPDENHWEARWVAPHIPLARGWERQLDVLRNGLFYRPSRPLTPAAYRAWLSEEAISYIALPDTTLDYSAKGEARLLRGAGAGGAPPAYLREVWRSSHWRLFAVRDPTPLAQAPATLTALSSDSFTLRAPRAGSYVVRLHFTPYWSVTRGGGCVAQAPGNWTEVSTRSAGPLEVGAVFSLTRIFNHGPRCSPGVMTPG